MNKEEEDDEEEMDGEEEDMQDSLVLEEGMLFKLP